MGGSNGRCCVAVLSMCAFFYAGTSDRHIYHGSMYTGTYKISYSLYRSIVMYAWYAYFVRYVPEEAYTYTDSGKPPRIIPRNAP